ncbi:MULTISPECIES: TonB-dependent siderophore receptor [unclassified Pseudomonas]|uniref:TonB-dependent siderophore receptor n=1 Tax=unclassified Pseudomonas TaxID=196821 RepID=UPI000C2FDB67|nr:MULTISPECIES: TonB-dependent siderophore receptor [unclassified Pseudomonas]MCU1738021.1 TonB-dependent siderophore receptor [Pseudomonas sp. 20S_6.2_Bac1]
MPLALSSSGFCLSGLASVLLLLNTPAWAAEGPLTLGTTAVTASEDEPADGPVQGYVARKTVVGTKTAATLLETPQSISVVTRQQMDDQAAQTLDQALRYTPGVYSQDNDLRFDQLSIRGFDADSYLDGLKLNRTTWFANPRIDPWFLERVDVLRGPASVLYGQSGPGGLVDMQSKQPTDTPLHVIQVGVGNDDRYQAGFDFGGPLDDQGKFSYRLTGLGRMADTQTDHIQEQRFAIAPAVSWQIDDDTRLTVLANYQYDPQGGLFNPVPVYGSVLRNPNGNLHPNDYLGDPDRDRFKRTQFSLGYQFSHRFNDTWTFRQNTRYLHDDVDYYQTSLTGPLDADLQTAPLWANVNDEHLGQFAMDNQLQADFATGAIKHSVLMGADLQRLQQQINRGGQYFPNAINIYNPNFSALPTVPVTTSQYTTQSQFGAYVQDQLSLDHWRWLIGARQDWASTYDNQDAKLTGANLSNTRQRDSKLTWRSGLSYVFDNGLAPYASYSESFQPQVGTDREGKTFVPTTGKQYEVGIKYQPVGSRSLYSAAVFDLRQQNVLTTDDVDPNYETQKGEIRSRGLELEAHGELTDNLSLIGFYTWMDQRIVHSNDGDQGEHPTGIPGESASLWADYTFHDGALKGIGFGGGARYFGASYGSSDNQLKVPARTLFDASAHYDVEHWRLALNASNLFNKEYLAYCSNGFLCYWGATRTLQASATYKW